MRCAIYWAPSRASPLWRFGCAWLGRDPETGGVPPRIDQLADAEWQRAVAEPRRYGLHATLKAPFPLAEGTDPAGLEAALAAFAARTAPVMAGPLTRRLIGSFIALVPAGTAAPVAALAADCVRAFDPFRAALTPAELAKRRQASLSPEEDALLLRWGYPYVMERFRFHVTLSSSLDEPDQAVVGAELDRLIGARGPFDLDLDEVALFIEPRPGQLFDLVRRFPLAG